MCYHIDKDDDYYCSYFISNKQRYLLYHVIITRKQSKIFVLSMYLFYISDKFLVIGTIIGFSNKQEHNTHAL